MSTITNANFCVDEVRDLSNEELGALLRGSGLDIRQLAKEAKALKMAKEAAKASGVDVNDMPFELTMAEYPDFVITKRTAKTVTHLVIMPSCDGYYLKTIKGENVTSEELTRERYSKFSSGMNPIVLPGDFWLPEVTAGVGFYDRLETIITSEEAVDAIRNKCFPKNLFSESAKEQHKLYQFIAMYKDIPILVREFYAKYPRLLFWKEYKYRFLKKMQDVFGLENTRNFIGELAESLIDVSCEKKKTKYGMYAYDNYANEKWLDEFFETPMKYACFKDYAIYSAYTMGYGDNWGLFLNDLKDTWQLQMDVYGKIKEKYPESLPTYHNLLSFKDRQLKNEIDEKKFAKHAAEIEYYEMTKGDFIFMVPKTGIDMLDEAGQQANCLAGYIDKFVAGETDIIFMRKKNFPEISYVTIEVRAGEIRQAVYARNKSLRDKDQAAVDRWFAEVQKRLAEM